MAGKQDISVNYPSQYGADNLFEEDEILTHEHMNFIAKNLDAILGKLLVWRNLE